MNENIARRDKVIKSIREASDTLVAQIVQHTKKRNRDDAVQVYNTLMGVLNPELDAILESLDESVQKSDCIWHCGPQYGQCDTSEPFVWDLSLMQAKYDAKKSRVAQKKAEQTQSSLGVSDEQTEIVEYEGFTFE